MSIDVWIGIDVAAHRSPAVSVSGSIGNGVVCEFPQQLSTKLV